MRDEYVVFRALGLGPVPFLQDHSYVLHVAVHKVNLDVFPVCFPSLTPLHRSPKLCQRHW